MRKLFALALACLFAAAAPCAALALCAAAQARGSCCGNAGAACCCHAGGHQTPAPAPVVPAPKVAPDQALQVAAAGNGLASAPGMAALTLAALGPSQPFPPAYLSACAFRC